MKVTTEALERCEFLMTVEVDSAKEQDMLKKAAKRIAREVQIPGFRPGKAPYNTVVRRFGLEAIQQEALEKSGDKILEDALKEADLNPIAQISFEEISWSPLTLKVKVPGPPQVDLGDYRSLRIEAEPVEVSEEDINAELETLRDQNATWAPVERPSQLGDLITMAVVEKDGDEVLSEHDSIEYELILPEEEDEAEEPADDEAEADDVEEAEETDETDEADDWQPDLTTPLLGLSADEEKTFSITYPDSYDDDRYAGKEITFTVKVSSVKEKELDPLDDDFAQSVSDVDTLDALKEKIETNLREHRQLHADQKIGMDLLDKIVEGVQKIEWPVALEEEMVDEELERYSQQLGRSGLNLDSYLAIEKKSKDELREEIRENSIEGLKKSIVLSELAKVEKLTVSNSEVLERAKAIADMFGAGGEQIWQHLISSNSQQSRLANEVLSSKVITRLAEIAKGEAPDLTDEADQEPATETAEPAASTDSDDDNEADETTTEPVATTKA